MEPLPSIEGCSTVIVAVPQLSLIDDSRTNIREIDRGLDNVLKLVPKSINTRRTRQMLHLVLVLWRKRFKRSILI